MQGAVDAQHAGVGKVENQVGAHRLRAKVEFPRVLWSQRDGKIGVEERERLLLVAFLEIDARVFRLNVGKARSAAGVALARRGIWDMRCLHQNRSKIPTPIGFPDEVQTGVVEMDTGDFKLSPPQGQEPQVCHHAVRVKDGLGTELWIFFYGKIRELKAGQGQQSQLDGRDVYLAADATADAVGNAMLIPADVDQRRQDKGNH